MEKEKKKMKAKKKARIAIIVGGILGFFMGLASIYVSEIQDATIFLILPVFIFAFMLYGFGYTFGWERTKRWLVTALGLSANIMMFAIFLQIFRRKGLFGGTVIAILVFSFIVGLAWIPGVFQGIIELYREHKAEKLANQPTI